MHHVNNIKYSIKNIHDVKLNKIIYARSFKR